MSREAREKSISKIVSGLVLVAEHRGRRYEIVYDGIAEFFYVYRYDGLGPRTTHDYLQDELDIARECALEEFGVPLNAWRPASAGETPAYED